MKVIKTIIAIILIIAFLGAAGFFGYKYVFKKHADEIAAEKQQSELLEQRVKEVLAERDDIQKKLAGAEGELEESKGLINSLQTRLDNLMEEVFVFDSAMIMEEIKDIGELATVEYRYTNVGTLDAKTEIEIFHLGIPIPLTGKTAIISMDGVIKVGVDVNGIKVTSNETAKTINVRLPKAKLLSNELDENSLQVYDESNQIFNKITLEDSSSLRTEIKDKAEENAKNNGVYDQAIKNAEQILTCMLESIPGVKDNYKIEFTVK